MKGVGYKTRNLKIFCFKKFQTSPRPLSLYGSALS